MILLIKELKAHGHSPKSPPPRAGKSSHLHANGYCTFCLLSNWTSLSCTSILVNPVSNTMSATVFPLTTPEQRRELLPSPQVVCLPSCTSPFTKQLFGWVPHRQMSQLSTLIELRFSPHLIGRRPPLLYSDSLTAPHSSTCLYSNAMLPTCT